MSWANAWHSIISWTGSDSSSIRRVSSYLEQLNTKQHSSQSTGIDVVYTWVNGSDPVLIDGLLAARAELRKSNVSRDAIIESWQEVNKCRTPSTVGYYFLEVPIGFVEPRVTDFAVSLLDAKQLDDSVFTSSSTKGSLLYFKNIDQCELKYSIYIYTARNLRRCLVRVLCNAMCISSVKADNSVCSLFFPLAHLHL